MVLGITRLFDSAFFIRIDDLVSFELHTIRLPSELLPLPMFFFHVRHVERVLTDNARIF